MSVMHKILSRALFLTVVTQSSTPAATATQDSTLLVTGVNVVDVRTGSVRKDVDIAISGDRIVAMGGNARSILGVGAPTVKAQGKFVIPGLWDMHVHAHRAGRANWFYPLFIAHGVTGVREMSSHLGSLLEWRHSAAVTPGPRVVWSSPMIDGAPPTWNQGLVAETPGAARELVRAMRALGFNFIKVYGRLSRETYFALADEARRVGIPFAGHVPYSVTPAEASDAGQRSIEHLWLVLESCIPGALDQVVALSDNQIGVPVDRGLVELLPKFDRQACDRLFSKFRTNNTWQTPTLVEERGATFVDDTAFVSDPRLVVVPASIRAEWESYRQSRSASDSDVGRTLFRRRMELVADMQRAGVGLLAGTDVSDEPWVFPGSSLHDELALMVESGLSPLEALQTATLNPASYLNAVDSMGTVAPGRVADLVVLDGNPLDDIGNTRRIHALILKGRLFDRTSLDRLIKIAKDAASH